MARSPITKVTLGEGSSQLDISSMITSFNYKRSLTHDDTVEIDIEGKYADYLLEQPACSGGSPITFSYGYIGEEMTEPVTLMLGDIEPLYSSKSGVDLTLTNVDASHAMKKLHSNKIWQGMTIDKIVEALAELHGLHAEIQQFMQDPVSQQINLDNSTNRSSDSTNNAELITTQDQLNLSRLAQYKKATKYSINGSKPVPFKYLESFPQGWDSNHGMLQSLTSLQGIGFINYVKNGVIHFVQKNTSSPSLDTIIRGVSDTFISFKVKYKEITGKGSEMAINTQKFDVKSTETIILLGDYHLIGSDSQIFRANPDGSRTLLDDVEGTGELSTTLNSALQSNHVTNISANDLKLYLMGKQQNTSIRQSLDERVAIAQEGILDLKGEILTGTLTEEGTIFRDVNAVITIGGLASMYNGNWYITDVSDTINADGFRTVSTTTKGEVKKGIVPTTASNTVSGTKDKKREVSAVSGWDYPQGVNVNNPQINPNQSSNKKPSEQSNFKITTRQ